MKRIFGILLSLVLLAAPGLAESVTLEGTVVATKTVAVLSRGAGVLEEVSVQEGDRVEAGQELAALMCDVTYAEVSGTVKLYGEPGESVETLTERYGAVAYVTPDIAFTVSATTRSAYDAAENKIIRSGETVYLRGTTDTDKTGVGMVTVVSGSSYTVEVTESTLEDGDTVYIYRDAALSAASRIGKGTVNHTEQAACTGSGAVSEIYVTDGAHVEEGQPLFGTVETDAYTQRLASSVNGTVAKVQASPGDAVEAGTLIATVYPEDTLRLRVLANETELQGIASGQRVTLSFADGAAAQGVVERIAGDRYTAAEGEDIDDSDVLFAVYVQVDGEATLACGMTVQVTFTP